MTASPAAHSKTAFFPREHGATAMLLTPIACAAILARQWRWTELATLLAAFAALAAKDPLVTLARQRLIWKQPHPETAVAARWLGVWLGILIACGLLLVTAWPWSAILGLGLGVAAFSLLAVVVNVKNRQRSTLFQIVSAAALTSGSLATCLSATGRIEPWCWWLWLLLAMQAAAGILVVHARLDARIVMRGRAPADHRFRRAAQIALGVLSAAAIAAALLGRFWITLALLVAVAGYAFDLHAQRGSTALQVPLRKVGQRALALSLVYAILLLLGLR